MNSNEDFSKFAFRCKNLFVDRTFMFSTIFEGKVQEWFPEGLDNVKNCHKKAEYIFRHNLETSGVNFTNILRLAFCASRFTPILLAHGVERKAQKLSVYLLCLIVN